MTGPLIELFPIGDESRTVLGAGRVLWAQIRPSQSATPVQVWYTPGVETALSMNENPAGQQVLSFDAGAGGAYLARGALTGRLWAIDDRATLQSPFFNALSPVAYPDPCGVLVFREVVQWTQNIVGAAGNACSFHGFACVFDTQGNAGWAVDVLGGTVFAGVGIVYRPFNGTYRLITKARPTPASFKPAIPYVGASWNLLEHRLYAPTINRVGRYELWINQVKIAEILGTDPDFPQVDGSTVRYRPCPYITENYAGKAGGLRVRRSEIIVGPDTDATVAYE